MTIIVILFFLIAPILTVPLSIWGLINDKKHRLIYGMLLSFIIAIVAYYWIPESNYDLYRHHLNMDEIRYTGFFQAISNIPEDQDTLAFMISYVIAKLNCNDLLQFFVCFTGYSIVFFILTDYAKRKDIPTITFVLITLFILVTMGYINFISGLWNMLAMLIFALGIYLEYIGKKHKLLCYCCYAIAALLHISMLFPIIIKIIFDISKQKINIRLLLILILILLLPQTIFTLLSNFTNIGIFHELLNMYNAYFLGNEEFAYLHTGIALFVELIKASIYVLVYLLLGKKKEPYHNIVLVFLLATGMLMINSGIFMRFIFLVQILGIPMLMDYFKQEKNKQKVIAIVYIVILILGLGFYQYRGIINMNYGNLKENCTNNIVTIFEKER